MYSSHWELVLPVGLFSKTSLTRKDKRYHALLALFLLVVAYKFLTNLMHYFRIKKLQTYFSEFLEHKRSDMNLYRQEVLSLFEKLMIKDIKIPVSEHIGNRKIVSGNVSTFSMFPSTRTEFSVTVLNCSKRQKACSAKICLICFNPFYWIDLIVFLPNHYWLILEYPLKLPLTRYAMSYLPSSGGYSEFLLFISNPNSKISLSNWCEIFKMNFDNITSPLAFPVSAIFACEDSRFFNCLFSYV